MTPSTPSEVAALSSKSASPHSSAGDIVDPSAAQISRLKRRIAALELDAENNAQQQQKKKTTVTTSTMGRGIRCLVTMFDALDALVIEADRRCDEDWNDERVGLTEDELEGRIDQDRAYKGYNILLGLVPSLSALLNDGNSDPDDLDNFIAQLQKGANDARSDDVRRVKEELGGWLNETFKPAVPFSIKSRGDRGFQNDITGRLLCPIDYDWDNEQIRLDIKAGTLSVADDLFLACLYPKSKGDAQNVDEKFLRSRLLVKTYCAIFTSPTSSENFEDEESIEGPERKKKRHTSQQKATKASVATLLHMNNTVALRSIAYTAVLLAFNLTDAVQWIEVYNGFNFRVLWNFIVDYFEETPDDISATKARDLLKWWNKQVFPQQGYAIATSRKSRNKLMNQRSRAQHNSHAT